MTTTTVYADVSDGHILSVNGTYATARSGGTLTAQASGDNVTGQSKPSTYRCFEGFYSFNTSDVPDTDTVSAAVLSLYGITDASVTDFTVEARSRDWGGTLETTDYVAGADLSALTLLATFATSGGFSTVAYNDFTSETAFADAINKTGSTLLLLDSDRHVAGTAPTGNEYVTAAKADTAGTTYDPKLVVTHDAAGTTGTGGVTQPAAALAASGTETFSGTGGVTQTSALAGSGMEIFTGTGGVTQPAAALAASGTETFTGTGGVTQQAAALATEGTVTAGEVPAPAPTPGGGGSVIDFIKPLSDEARRILEAQRRAVYGTGGVTQQAASIQGEGNTNDDDQFLFLLAVS